MKKVHVILAPKKMISPSSLVMRKKKYATVEQPREEPTTPVVILTMNDDRNLPPSFLKIRKEELTKTLQEIYEVTERLENLTLSIFLPIVNHR